MNEQKVVKKDLRIIWEDNDYYITEVGYDKQDKPITFLQPECGITSYWSSYKKLQKSCESIDVAFKKPILYLQAINSKRVMINGKQSLCLRYNSSKWEPVMCIELTASEKPKFRKDDGKQN